LEVGTQFSGFWIQDSRCWIITDKHLFKLWLWGFENFAGVAGVQAAVSAAAAVPLPSSFREVNGIVEAPPITAGPPASVVEAIVIFENIFFSQFLHSPSSTPAYLLTAHSLSSFETQRAQRI
jgi:hypothetical protein